MKKNKQNEKWVLQISNDCWKVKFQEHQTKVDRATIKWKKRYDKSWRSKIRLVGIPEMESKGKREEEIKKKIPRAEHQVKRLHQVLQKMTKSIHIGTFLQNFRTFGIQIRS